MDQDQKARHRARHWQSRTPHRQRQRVSWQTRVRPCAPPLTIFIDADSNSDTIIPIFQRAALPITPSLLAACRVFHELCVIVPRGCSVESCRGWRWASGERKADFVTVDRKTGGPAYGARRRLGVRPTACSGPSEELGDARGGGEIEPPQQLCIQHDNHRRNRHQDRAHAHRQHEPDRRDYRRRAAPRSGCSRPPTTGSASPCGTTRATAR